MNPAEKYIEKQLSILNKNKDIPHFKPGDILKIYNRVVDESNNRTQIFEGVCIARTNSGLGSTFKVKKISCGMCFEKTFPLYSPLLEKIIVLKKSKVRRAKLYYMREFVGKAARIKEAKNFYTKKKIID